MTEPQDPERTRVGRGDDGDRGPPGGALAGDLVLGRYRLVRELGAGGFGAVFLARDQQLDRDVAVKAVPRATSAPQARADREAIVAARLNHPGIVTLYEAASDERAHYLVSELVGGAPLSELIAADALSDRDVVRIGIALCDALEHAHARGVIHRDVKPQNVMVPAAPETAAGVAKLTDFGVARLVGDDPLTHTGDVIGTLAYMAPEQADGRPAEEEADLYALGIVLYEALSGRNPVRAAGPAATARRVGATVPSLRRARRRAPAALVAAIDRAVRARPEQRGSLADLRDGLEAALPRLRAEGGPPPVAGWEDGRPGRSALPAGRGIRRAPSAAAPGWDDRAAPGSAAAADRDDRAAAGAAGPWDGDVEPIVHDRRGGTAIWPGPGADAGLAPEDRAAGAEYEPGPGALDPAPARPSLRPRARVAAGLGALALGTAAAALVGTGAPSRCLAAGLAAGVAACLLPRVAWLAGVTVLCGWLIGADPSRAGEALLVVAAALPIVVLLRTSGSWWSLPAIAPALGWAGLAGAFPAVAGTARGWWRRAALGACGFWVLSLAEALFGRDLYLGRAVGTLPAAAWRGSVDGAVEHALVPLLSSGALGGALVWAAAAVVLPWLVRGRTVAMDVLGATAWVAAVTAAGALLGHALAQQVRHPDPRGALAGAALAGVAIVLVRAGRRADSEPPAVP